LKCLRCILSSRCFHLIIVLFHPPQISPAFSLLLFKLPSFFLSRIGFFSADQRTRLGPRPSFRFGVTMYLPKASLPSFLFFFFLAPRSPTFTLFFCHRLLSIRVHRPGFCPFFFYFYLILRCWFFFRGLFPPISFREILLT